MIIILAIDGLEYDKVEEFECSNLKLDYYGQTDISDFSLPMTMVLWSSFLTGENKESEILKDGKEKMWDKKVSVKETFLYSFGRSICIDMPSFNYDLKIHKRSRELLKLYFSSKDLKIKSKTLNKYNNHAFKHHRHIISKFHKVLGKDFDIILCYFSVIDAVGHLNFGDSSLMKSVYTQLDNLAKEIRYKNHKIIIVSDHGMKAIGMFGDHSNYGFWSTNFKELGTPKITEFKNMVLRLKEIK